MQTSKPFYLHWIKLDELFKRLYELELAEQERHELTERILTTIHYELLDAVLSMIPENEHELLLSNMTKHSTPHDVLSPHTISIEIVETVVKKRGESIMKQIHDALQHD